MSIENPTSFPGNKSMGQCRVQAMAGRLFGTKPLREAAVGYMFISGVWNAVSYNSMLIVYDFFY